MEQINHRISALSGSVRMRTKTAPGHAQSDCDQRHIDPRIQSLRSLHQQFNATPHQFREQHMSKFLSLGLALALMAPVALATLNQAALIVA
jgi:hypothetical protein